MHKVMVFIDYQNFFISWKWKNRGRKPPFVDYQKLGRLINRQIPLDSEVIKTYLFAYKPCDELMLLEPYQRYYNWLTGMKKIPYLEVIEGRQDIHRIYGVEFDINDPSTYTTEEKETDINIATHMIAKGFQNAYDIAILVSGDTDYVQVIRTLHDLGKIVVIAHFPEQNIAKYQGMYDAEVILDDAGNVKIPPCLVHSLRPARPDAEVLSHSNGQELHGFVFSFDHLPFLLLCCL